MKDKVLIIGCSFSAGWWTLAENQVKKNTGACEDLHDDYGWYDELPSEDEYTIYSHPAGGYLNYAHLINKLSDSGELSQYSKCIIQETWEPRVCLFVHDDYMPVLSRDNIHLYQQRGLKSFVKNMILPGKSGLVDDISKRWFTRFSDAQKNYLTDIGNSVYLDTAIESSALAIDRILQNANIPAYRFNVSEKQNHLELPHIRHITELDIHKEMFTIFDIHRTGSGLPEPLGTLGGHLTKQGTKLMGKAVANKLKDFL